MPRRHSVRSAAVIAASSRSGTGSHGSWLLALVIGGIVTVGGACDFRYDPGGGGQPPSDCISPQKPTGGTLCGLNAWDRDGDTISETTENNTANATANGGFYNFSNLQWDINYSQARGVATGGSLYKGMNLPDQWTGYNHFDNCERLVFPAGPDKDDWGTGHLVRLIEGAGRWWVQLQSGSVRMQVGDLSLKEGGRFLGQPQIQGCEADHEYHQQGVDVDIRYVRNDGGEGPINICIDSTLYDPAQTSVLISSFLRAEQGDDANARIDSVFVDLNCLRFPDTTTSGRKWAFHKNGHQNHFHVRIRDPDGPAN